MDNTILFEKLSAYGADIDGIMDRFIGDKELYGRCFDDFLVEPNFEKLKNAIKNDNFDEAFESAHALKGLIGNLGLTPLYKSICNLVERLRNKDYGKVKEEYKNMSIEFEKLIVFVSV